MIAIYRIRFKQTLDSGQIVYGMIELPAPSLASARRNAQNVFPGWTLYHSKRLEAYKGTL